MLDIILTEQSKGYSTIIKECPNCKGKIFFGIKDGKVASVDGAGYWQSFHVVRCDFCAAEYKFELKDV